MEVDCEGCAGCCIDWRPLVDDPPDFERRGRYEPLDDAYNLAPLSGDEVRAFLEAGYGDAMTPRLFAADEGVRVDGHTLAAADGRPAFYVGLRKAPKPVAPFGVDAEGLPTCVFLDPESLQCRLHGGDLYPETCSTYPGKNLALGRETECERVERGFGGDRLLDDEPPADAAPDPYALGATVFVYPDPGRLVDRVARIADGEPTRSDRAEFVAVAAASRPGTADVDEERYERARERVLAARSWVGAAVEEWRDRATDGATPRPSAERVEESRGAPGTPGWD